MHSPRNLFVAAALALAVLLPVMQAGDRRIGNHASPGELKTKVKPNNTGVWVDGEYAGHADRFSGPGERLYLDPGEHEIRLTRVFHHDHVEKVTIKSGEKTVLRHKMQPNGDKPAPGPYAKIKIHPSPELNAGLIVDGYHIGYADQVNKIAQTLLLPAGEHTIELVYEGYKPYKTTINVKAGEKKVLTPTMEPE